MALETDAAAPAGRPSGWGRVPGWLGVGGALLGLAAFSLPWYSAGGATYSGFALLWNTPIYYDVPAYHSAEICDGNLSGVGLPVALMGGLLIVALAVSLGLALLRLRRGVAFGLSLALLVASWLGVGLLYFWIMFVLPTSNPTLGDALGPDCPPIGARDVGLSVLLASLLVLIVAYLWGMALTLLSAPWLLGACAALGLFGFLAPWDFSLTSGIWRFASAASCAMSAGWNAPVCLPGDVGAPLSPTGGPVALASAVYFPFYAAQMILLLAVLLIALLAARWRTARWLRALQIVSLITGVSGLLSGVLLEFVIAVAALAPGAGIVALAFLLLTIYAGRAGEEAVGQRERQDGAGGQPVAATTLASDATHRAGA